MPQITIVYGEEIKIIEAPAGTLLGDVITQAELPLEQPCAGRGTCGKCKVLVEEGAAPPDNIEQKNLTPGELALGTRLACRARVETATRVVLSPLVVYSDKVFRGDCDYTQNVEAGFGLAIDLGTTTVAAFLTRLTDKKVCAGAAVLNQQAIYGADVISRLNAALQSENAQRLQRLALASIYQAVEALKLPKSPRPRIERITIVGNSAMHHLLLGLPVDTLATFSTVH